ncbi:MAG: hypothetical protein IIC20_09225 [Chloroflexi bacterium]|nr:hypothetical protein [Chloroflexota bacterium]
MCYLDSDPLEMFAELRAKTPEWRAAGRVEDFGPAVKRLLHGPFQSITGDAFDWFDHEE